VKNILHLTKDRYLRGLLFIFFSLLSIRAAAPDFKVGYILASKPINPFDRLINAVVQVESLGDTLAFNRVEEAIGAFQIRPIRIRDYNQRTGSNYKSSDCYNFEISKEIFLFYAKRIGYPDYESIAREWNGRGKTKLVYWKKVKTYL
jgi:hypothetical protein